MSSAYPVHSQDNTLLFTEFLSSLMFLTDEYYVRNMHCLPAYQSIECKIDSHLMIAKFHWYTSRQIKEIKSRKKYAAPRMAFNNNSSAKHPPTFRCHSDSVAY